MSERFPHFLLIAYLLLFAVLAFEPYDRATWFVENLTIVLIVGVLVMLYQRGVKFSHTAYVLMSVLIYLHTIGGHYTFERVPFDYVTDFFGFARNHFDRIAHFSVGFYAYPIVELLWERRIIRHHLVLVTYPILAIATVAMSYELIEWIYAANADAAAGAAYLGSQGDIWDAQKDMLADTLGAVVATSYFFWNTGYARIRHTLATLRA